MHLRFFFFLVLLSLVLAASALSQQPQSTRAALNNDDVVDMLRVGLTPEIVVAKIRASACNFDTSPAALNELKAAKVPDAVILAMVQAPVKTPSATTAAPAQQHEQSDSSVASRGQTGYAECGVGGSEISVLPAPGKLPAVATLKCGARVTVLSEQNGYGWYKVRTENGVEGYVSHWFLRGISRPPAPPPTSAQTSSMPPSIVRSLGYRVVPQQSTAYLRHEGQSSSTCYGEGWWSGLTDTLNIDMNCNTTYSAPTEIPITWHFADVYNLVETNTQRYVISCRANWSWSKCSPLVPGRRFKIEVGGRDMWVTAYRKGKAVRIKYNILQVAPK